VDFTDSETAPLRHTMNVMDPQRRPVLVATIPAAAERLCGLLADQGVV
jgi:hypothetical protein